MNPEYPVPIESGPVRTFGRRRMDIAIHALVAVEVALILGLYIMVLQGLVDMSAARDAQRAETLRTQKLNREYAEIIYRGLTER